MDNQLSHTTQGLPLTQQALSHSQHEKLVDELLVRSMRLLDICGSIRDVVSQVKGHVHDIQSTQRDASFLKKLKKTVKKSVEKLKQVDHIYDSKLLNLDNHLSSVIKFLEKNLISQEARERAVELEEIEDEDTSPSENTSEFLLRLKEHSLRDLNEPTNYKAKLLDPESNKWLDAMNAEMQSMKDNQVWRLVDLPSNGKTFRSKWLFKKKTDMNGNIHTYKTLLVAKGYTQTYKIGYEKTFSPAADIRAIRILIAIVHSITIRYA
ncbi:retrotransposon protein, putative, ty1-copia subclass [Tanacetum coccineum]|uniref:Retrotransposon protein, putative, ty1-copia subclass n=1 Tax=Tanacetum coccineum TaxID=301880 RepID=A0ABQ4X1Q4_9ASTR